jgi:hypothetical protein
VQCKPGEHLEGVCVRARPALRPDVAGHVLLALPGAKFLGR